MPHPWRQRSHRRCLWTVLFLAILIVIVMPLNLMASYNIAGDGESPGGDGQPDDVGALHPGWLQTVIHTWNSVSHWVDTLFHWRGFPA